MVHTSRRERFEPPDGGWGWIVCFTSMICNGTIAGIINTFGILYTYLVKDFGEDDELVAFRTAWIGAVSTGLTFMTCIVSSILSAKFGIRPTAFIGCFLGAAGLVTSAFVKQLELLYLTFGVCVGLGSGLMYSPSLVILGHYFRKHLGFVNGIVVFGSALFSTILSIVLPLLLETIGIKFVFIILASLYIVVAFCCLTWRELMPEQDVSDKRCLLLCNRDLFKTKAYVIWAVASTIALIGYFVPFMHIVKHSQDVFPKENGSWLIMCTQITSGIGRLLFGKISDLNVVNRIRMQQTAFLCMGILTTCIPFSQSYTGLIIICLVLGLTDGAMVCLWGPIAFDIVGPHRASQAIGFLLGMFSMPFLIGAPLAGFIYDQMGTYDIAFYAAGAPPILGALIMFLIPKYDEWETRDVQHTNKAYNEEEVFHEKDKEKSSVKRRENYGIVFLVILMVVIVIVLIVEISRIDHSEKPKSGRCPPLTVADVVCIDDCKIDKSCPGDMKCCPARCGLLKCQKPYTETSSSREESVDMLSSSFSNTLHSTSPSHPLIQATSPSHPVIQATSPSHQTIQTTSPAQQTIQTTSPSQQTIQTTSPSHQMIQTTSPSHQTIQITSPSQQTIKTTSPSQQTIQTTSPSQQTIQTTSPSKQTTQTTSPSHQTIQTTSPSQQTIQTTSPSKQTIQTTSSSHQTIQTTSPSHQTIQMTSPSQQTIKTASPSQQTIQTTSPSQQTIQTTSPSKQTIQTTSPSHQTIQTTSPSQQMIQTTSPSKQTIQTTSSSHQTIQTTSPSQQTIQTTSPSKQTIETTSPSHQTIQTTSPSQQTIQTTSPAKQTIETTSPYHQTIETTSPSHQTIQTTPPSQQTIQTTSPSQQTIQTTSPSQQTIQTTSPSKQTIQATSPSKQTIQTTSPSQQTIQFTSPSKQTIQTTSPSHQTIQTSSPTSIINTPLVTRSDSYEYMESTTIMDIRPSSSQEDSSVYQTASVV